MALVVSGLFTHLRTGMECDRLGKALKRPRALNMNKLKSNCPAIHDIMGASTKI
jgi:hypothetical protein